MPTLPTNFHEKLKDLETRLEDGNFTHDNLKNLFDHYSVLKNN